MKGEAKKKTKSVNDVYKKIIACLILVVMFTVYILPLQIVLAIEIENIEKENSILSLNEESITRIRESIPSELKKNKKTYQTVIDMRDVRWNYIKIDEEVFSKVKPRTLDWSNINFYEDVMNPGKKNEGYLVECSMSGGFVKLKFEEINLANSTFNGVGLNTMYINRYLKNTTKIILEGAKIRGVTREEWNKLGLVKDGKIKLEYTNIEFPDDNSSQKPDTYNKKVDNNNNNNNKNNNNNNNTNNNNNNNNNNTIANQQLDNYYRERLINWGCREEWITELENGNTADFDNWWTYTANTYVTELSENQRQELVNELTTITGKPYRIDTVTTYYEDVGSTYWTIGVGVDEYKNNTIYYSGKIDLSDDYGNKWNEDVFLNYKDPNGILHAVGWNKGEIKVTQNGKYELFSNWSRDGMSAWISVPFTVTDIDNEKPKIKSVTQIAPTGNEQGASMQIDVTDNSGLKSIYIESVKDKSKNWTINIGGDKEKRVEQTVPESGNYRIVVEDNAGNKEETTTEIKVDTTKPEPEGKPRVDIRRTAETYNDMPIVKKGDIVYIYVTANKKIKSIGNPSNLNTGNGAIQLASGNYSEIYEHKMQNVNSQTIPIEIEITENLINDLDLQGKSGAVNLSLFYVRDEYNNKGESYDESGQAHTNFAFDNLFYIDDKAPSLIESKISSVKNNNGGSYTDKQGNKFMLIQSGATYNIKLTFDEELLSNPTLKIGKSEKKIETTFEKGQNKNNVVYTAEINCDELIEEGKLQKNSDAPITISNIVDKVGHKAEDVVIDKNNKTSNQYSLNYGLVETEVFFVAAKDIIEASKITKGDINADGVINSYDEYLLKLAMEDPKALKEEERKRADLNKDNSIDNKDLNEMKKITDTAINYIYKSVGKSFTVYDENNELIKDDKLNWLILDGDGKEIHNGEDANSTEIEYDKSTGELYVKVQKGVKSPIAVKAYIDKEDDEDQRKVGTLNLVIVDENDSSNAWIKINGENKTGHDIKGDINNDGYITGYDAILALKHSVKLVTLTEDEIKRGDMDGDGKVDAADSMLIQRTEIGLEQSEDENNKSYDNTICNIIKKGDSVTLDLTFEEGESGPLYTYKDIKDKKNAEINWELITNYKDSFKLEKNEEDGTVKLTALEDVEESDGAIAVVRGELKYSDSDEQNTPVGIIYWKVADKTNIEIPNDTIQISLDNKEVETDIIANVNIDNQKVEYKSNNNEIVEVKEDNYGNAKILAKASGDAIVVIESDGEKKEINVNVTKAIESIDVNKTDVTVKQGTEEEFKVTINPSNATEDLKVESKDTNIARISYDEQAKTYKISGVQEGNTVVEIYSASNSELKKTINVKVEKMELPTITKVIVENNEEGKVYKAGDEMYLRVNFDGSVIGTVPELKIKFGDYYSVNKTTFVEGIENNTVLRYKYTVAEGDNGDLMVEKLSGGLLTDTTKQIQAITSQDNDIYNLIQQENPEKEYINDGIYKTVEGVTADTTNPTVRIVTDVDKDCNWLKNGDEIKVQILSEENLQEKPTVYFNGQEAKVEGENSVYTASMKVNSKLSDEYLEIKVDNIVDTAGNTHEAVVAKEDNINEPIIIDNSAPTVESVKIRKEEGKELAEGEKVDIIVNFKDTANVTKEYITASEVPELDLKFGGKAAQGTITSDYEVGKYVESIKYTYTVAKEDKGEITVDSMSGTVTDVAGNVTDLSKIKIASQISQNTPNNNSNNNNKNNNTNQNTAPSLTYSVQSPKTGDKIVKYICILLAVGVVIVVVEYCYRKNKKDKKIKWKNK